jgi:hypothetical protein
MGIRLGSNSACYIFFVPAHASTQRRPVLGGDGRSLNETAVAQAHDRMIYLNTLRRELANHLVWQDPDRYLQLYQLIHAETATFKDLQRSQALARLLELSKKYPQYQDFDLMAPATM